MVTATMENPSATKRRGRSRSPSAMLKSARKNAKGLMSGKSKKNLVKDSSSGVNNKGAVDGASASLGGVIDLNSSTNSGDYDDEVTTYDVEVDNASVTTGVTAASPAAKIPDNTSTNASTPAPAPAATPAPEPEPAPATTPVPKEKTSAEPQEPKLVAEPTTKKESISRSSSSSSNSTAAVAPPTKAKAKAKATAKATAKTTTKTKTKTKTKTRSTSKTQNTATVDSIKRPAPAQVLPPDSKTPKASLDTATTTNNTTNTNTNPTNNDTPLQVILLLMDANSRRFELIQLAFDAENASVKDVIGQIALSATENALRSQTYTDVCLPDGFLMKNDSYLKDYNDQIEAQKHMLLAIPTGMLTSECTKLAVPILNDPKVKAMLSGIESPKPSSKSKKNTIKHDSRSTAAMARSDANFASARAATGQDGDASSSIASFKLFLVLLAMVVPILLYVHYHVSSTLSPGDVLPTGHWRSKCGLLPCRKNRVLSLTPDGILSIHNNEGETIWEMKGKCKSGGKCVARVGQNGKPTIGSSLGKLMEGRPGIAYPWPFTVEPSTKTKKRRKKKTKKN